MVMTISAPISRIMLCVSSPKLVRRPFTLADRIYSCRVVDRWEDKGVLSCPRGILVVTEYLGSMVEEVYRLLCPGGPLVRSPLGLEV